MAATNLTAGTSTDSPGPIYGTQLVKHWPLVTQKDVPVPAVQLSALLVPPLLLLARLLQGMSPASPPTSLEAHSMTPSSPPGRWAQLSCVPCPHHPDTKLPTWNVVSWIVQGANILLLLPALRAAFQVPGFPAKGAWFTVEKWIFCFSWANLKLLTGSLLFPPSVPIGGISLRFCVKGEKSSILQLGLLWGSCNSFVAKRTTCYRELHRSVCWWDFMVAYHR